MLAAATMLAAALVPVPLPPDAKAQSNAWSFGADLQWSQQLELLLTLQRLAEHYAGAVFSSFRLGP